MPTEFSDAFLYVAEFHAAWGAEQLDALTGFLPAGAAWTADLDTCTYRQGDREIRVAIAGTYDASDHSWLWGWANPGWRGTPVVRAAEVLERFGQERGIAEFSTPQLDLSGFPDPRRAAETLAFAAMGVLGAAGYVGVEAGPGTRVYFLSDDPQDPRALIDPVTLPRRLTTGAGLIGFSPRSVVAGYFDHHALQPQGEGNRISAELPDGSTAVVDFDDAGRIASISLRVKGA